MGSELRANDFQIGGDHYKAEYIHWDLVVTVPLSYLEGCTTKHVTRWRKKGQPVSDLKKALHYLNKLIEVDFHIARSLTEAEALVEVARFAKANELQDMEWRYVEILSTWKDKAELSEARDILLFLLDAADTPVPLTEENHHAAHKDTTGG